MSVVVFGFPDYTRTYGVLEDGTISGVGFEHVRAAGKTLAELKAIIQGELAKTIRNPQVNLVLESAQAQFVFVTGVGAMEYMPDLTLRQVIARVNVADRKEDFDVRVFRGGKEVLRVPYVKVVDGRSKDGSVQMKPNDVVTIVEQPMVRVWAAGAVRKPGEYRVPEGTDAQQLLALAGGVVDSLQFTSIYKLKLRRGPDLVDVDSSQLAPAKTLEAGDTLLVEAPRVVQITVGGEIQASGERRVREGSTLMQVIEGSGGVTGSGTYSNILVFRQGQALMIDAGKILTEGKQVDFVVQEGDMVWVQINQKRVTMLGWVRRPGPVLLRDGVQVRLADAVADAGGLDPQGSYRHVYLGRKQPDGKIRVIEFHLDKFMIDGDMTQNPEIEPGDVVMVGQPKGLSIAGVSQILSNFLIVQTIARR